MAGSTDVNAADARRIPALSIGCGRGGGMHTPRERISAASPAIGARQLDGVIRAVRAQAPTASHR